MRLSYTLLVGAQLLSYVILIACSCLLLRFLQLSVAPKRHQQAWGCTTAESIGFAGFMCTRFKKLICVKNELGFRQTRLRLHEALGLPIGEASSNRKS